MSSEGSKRLVKAACQYAQRQGSNHVTLVHKGNIMKFTEGGFKTWGYEVNEEDFGGKVRMDDCICDAFLQNALIKPEAYDVIATLNLNGDYISDMLAAQVGASASLRGPISTTSRIAPFLKPPTERRPTSPAPTAPTRARSSSRR